MKYTKLLGKVTLTTNGLHNSELEYDRLCLVYDDLHRSFISIKEVPAGISILNESYWQPISTVSADEEDITVSDDLLLKFKDKDYNPSVNSGMGYKILRKRNNNILTQNDFSQSNTLYVVSYDFYLDNKIITLPEGCAFYFKGGTINDGTIVGKNTIAYGTINNKGNANYSGEWNITGNVDKSEIDKLNDRLDELENIIGNIELGSDIYTLTVSEDQLFKKGTTNNVVITWKLIDNDGAIVEPDSITINNEYIDPQYSSYVFTDVTDTTTYNISVIKNGIQRTSSALVQFVDPSYFGIVDNIKITENTILNSTQILKDSKNYKAVFTQSNQRNFYAYPKEFGKLTSIVDISGLNLNRSYKCEEITVNNVTYYLYTLINASTVQDYIVNFE